MSKVTKYGPINPKLPQMWHGADYNPDQWLHDPQVLEEDVRLMKLAGCNVMSVGIFAWTALEPEEGQFNFNWLDQVMNRLYENGVYTILATPSAARPGWMSQKYPEVLRVGADRVRILHGERHNHCPTSPIYREKVQLINTKLAERYKDHPGLVLWHVSNEYGGGGECHCPLCQEAFRSWLRERYDEDLDKLNLAWWASFWSHTYTDWSQIESPAPHGERMTHGLVLDWKRFVTHQTIQFFKNEIAPLRKLTPHVPVTANFMGTWPGLDYWPFAKEVDVVSWDSYPRWHSEQPDWVTARNTAFAHDLNRCLKGGQPFMLMESTPCRTNWQRVAKTKRPGMHLLSSLQAVAHGSDTVQYFQWRKSRGSSEKFHGAVVDHCGSEHTRVFGDVAQVGEALAKLAPLCGTTVRPDVAIIYDTENRWAITEAQGFNEWRKDYELTCQRHYGVFWQQGIPVDVINMDCDFTDYKILIAPMLYMVRPHVARRIEEFVAQGGVFVATYITGMVDEHDLCFLGGFPGPLRKLLGIWSEEIDSLHDHDVNYLTMLPSNSLGLEGEYEVKTFCELIHAETSQVLGTYKEDFYAGRPALTVNQFGKGSAYYMACRLEDRFLRDFYTGIIQQVKPKQALKTTLPQGVSAQLRTDGKTDYVFLMNFTSLAHEVVLNEGSFVDLLSDKEFAGTVRLEGYDVKVLTAK